MSDSIDCPACHHEHDIGQLSDWYEHLPKGGNRMKWECAECEATFEVTVEWEPDFWPHADTVVLKSPPPPCKDEGRPSADRGEER